MPDVAFVLPSGQSRLGDLARALRTELERQGMRCSEHVRYPPAALDRVYVAVDPGRAVECDGAAALPDPLLLPRIAVLDAGGVPGMPPAPERLLAEAGRVFDMSQSAVSALHDRGIPGRLLRPGWCSAWDAFASAAPRDVDLAVVDRRVPRREAVLGKGAEVLARHRGCIRLTDQVDGPERRALFARSQTALLLHSGSDPRLDWLAAMDAIHTGAVILAEQATEIAPFEAGRHLFVGAAASLPWLAEELLSDPARLTAVREAAYARLRDWLPFSVSVGVFRAALLELLGAPLAPSDAAPWPVEEESEGAAIARELHHTRRDLRDMRRRIDHLQASVDGDGRAPVTAQTGAAWDAARDVPFAALLTAGEDPADTIATLGSVLDAEPAAEIVLIWPQEPDEAVLAWLAERPEVALATVRGAGGLAGARNTGLDAVRAAAVLVLDAGVRLMPRCARVLSDRLGQTPAPGYVFALQAVRDDGEASVTEDPAAPLMALAVRMREVGGFVGHSPGEPVGEDEIWPRLSEGGAQVPEILSVRGGRPLLATGR